jgi:hypothetical protein
MTTTSPPAAPPKVRGRPLLWLGLLAAFAGVPLYVLQIRAGNLMTPWYAPALATLGLVLVLVSRFRHRTVLRGLAFMLVTFIACFEWYFLLEMARLPSDTGRVFVKQELPEFTAYRADGSPFTQADLKGDKETVLVFFRGHW